MTERKMPLALFFGTRGSFPASLIQSAREEMSRILREEGHEVVMPEKNMTPFGAVETAEQGRKYAGFLERNREKFAGVILCLPNFGDENGALAALRDARVPILIQAYPDELEKVSPRDRRDAFCGKISVMNVFRQAGIPFTIMKPHTVHPESKEFRQNLDHFNRICRVVDGMKQLTVGAIGARTTPFKTVRIDETALQSRGITVETLDLTDLFSRMRKIRTDTSDFKEKRESLFSAARWNGVPETAAENLVKLGLALDTIVHEYRLDALALRCWAELQEEFGISPCALLGDLMDRGIPAACEVDTGSAVTMYALSLASGEAPAVLDWNNNYGDDPDKCILFHCGNVPPGLMKETGTISDHLIIANTFGPGSGYGCNTGRIRPMPFTFGNMSTEKGELTFYAGAGRITGDPIPEDCFGCAGVAEIDGLQDVLMWIGRHGFRHHVCITPGEITEPLSEAFREYLGYRLEILGGTDSSRQSGFVVPPEKQKELSKQK